MLFNTNKKELEKTQQELNNALVRLRKHEGITGRLVDYIQGYRMDLFNKLSKEKAKIRPNEKKTYAMEEQGSMLSEIQSRIIDDYWKD